ncbi:hypothetical protein HK102_003106 [Quaeritorhiza haematococci]|nr:hypothetical protein HK102_003106 [Quaeritorhiza haematococci]
MNMLMTDTGGGAGGNAGAGGDDDGTTTTHGASVLLTYENFTLELHPDDAKDKVLLAIVKALFKMGNRPSTPKELSTCILRHKLANLGYALNIKLE